MPPVASSVSYLQTLLYDLGRQGHTTGSIALSPGKHALHDGRYIDIAPQARAYAAVLPVNPYLGNRRSPGLVAYMSPVPVLRLPPGIQTHLGVKSLHLDSRGEMRLQGELGGADRRLLNYTHGPMSLADNLNALDRHFADICAKVAEHPVFSDVDAFDLEHSDLTWALEGGPTITFDAQGRLPFRGLKSERTEISLRPERDHTQQTSPPTLRVNHTCTLQATQGPDRTVVIELYASLGAAKVRAPTAPEIHEGRAEENAPGTASEQLPSSDSDTESEADGPPAISGATSPNMDRANYCAAIYAGLLTSMNVSGHLSLAKKNWTDIATLFPKVREHVEGWRMRCRSDIQIHLRREGNDMHMQADNPIRISLPEAHMPLRWGWLRRLLSRLLVVCVQRASVSMLHTSDQPNELSLLIHKARLQLGWIPVPFFQVSRQFALPLPSAPDLFAQVDHAAGKIARDYTFGPLVNLSHLTDLSQSDFQASSNRHCQCNLTEGYTLQARATSLHLGRSARHQVGGRLAIEHEASVTSETQERNLRLGAAFNIEGGALPVPAFVGEDPPGPSIQVLTENGIGVRATLGPEATHAVLSAAAGGLKGLAAGSVRVMGRGVKKIVSAYNPGSHQSDCS